ncbi:MAG: F0F1 ATP synthase subunit B [Planctomycetia bacterium]|nr:F0F1 ATP synthase subunit B [Planctomycetia bacterium]MDO5113041.1 F0F1 ATP synthase subunit B [Planctomycetia bacterium]
MNLRRWMILSAIVLVLGFFFAWGDATPTLWASGHGAEGGNSLNPLESIRGDLTLWTAVTFLVVLAILWKFAWGPIMDGLEKRENYVFSQRSEAEKANEDARALLAEYKTQLAQAKSEIQAMRAEATANAEKAATLLMDKTKADIQASRRAATQEIENAKIQAQKELAGMSAELAVQLAGVILKQKLDPASHRKLIDQAVANFGK